MWKESYRIGIEVIDKQHEELFEKADELLKAIEDRQRPEVFRRIVGFLMDYVVVHFRDEEAYQESIQYSGIEEHKKQHRDFARTVRNYEKELEETGYDLGTVKGLAGTLTAWLIYHVADSDQRIAGKEMKGLEAKDSYVKSFSASMTDVLETMAGLGASGTAASTGGRQMAGDVFVEVGIIGDVKGKAIFSFTKELAFRLFESMTFMQPDDIDEMVCSALAELSNIASGNAATALSEKGIACDLCPPVISQTAPAFAAELEEMQIDTELGAMEVAFLCA